MERTREEAERFYVSRRWRRVRRVVLAAEPLCLDPEGLHHERAEGCPPATEVHHQVRVRESAALALDPENLVPVCSDCHRLLSKLEREEDLYRGSGREWASVRPAAAARLVAKAVEKAKGRRA